MKLPRSLRIVLITIALVFSIWATGYSVFAYRITHMYIPDGADPKPDAIIVVTGGSSRINKGLDLLQNGFTDNLFISGVNKKVSLDTLLSIWDGYDPHNPPCCITLGHTAKNTWENALETRLWVNAQDNIKTLWLITSNYHMPRAWVELHSAMPELDIVPYPVNSDVTMHEQGGFFRVSLSEYNKTILTYLRLKLIHLDDREEEEKI